MKLKADKLFINGRIYTLEAEGICREALAVKDGRIDFIGTNEDAAAGVDARETIDLAGRAMLPGLGDSHLHFFAYCQTLLTVNLSGAKNSEEAIAMLKSRADETPEGEWIRGNNFDESKWSDWDGTLPKRDFLDKASTRHPIVMKRVDLHTAIANTAALEKAGIGRNFVYGEHGKVELDAEGYPNGIIREQAQGIYDNLIPDDTKKPETKKKLMKQALREASSDGITQIHTYAADIWKYTEDLGDYLNLDRAGELPLRVSIYLDTYYTDPFVPKKAMDDPYRKVQYGGFKSFADGALGSRSAKLFEPYNDDPTTDGILIQSQDELNERILKAYEMGLQPATHCIGDKGLDAVVTAIEYTLQKSREHGMTEREQRDRLPFRIIHAQMANPDLIRRMSHLPVVLDIQPTFYCTDLHWIVDRVGEKRAANSYQWKTYLDHGLMLLGGSDSPVENFSPWIGIYAAVTRKDQDGYPDGGSHPEEKVSVYDAICMYSKNIPYAVGQEDYLGTLETGKFADLVVTDRDPFAIPEDDLINVKVDATYLAGEEVYRR